MVLNLRRSFLVLPLQHLELVLPRVIHRVNPIKTNPHHLRQVDHQFLLQVNNKVEVKLRRLPLLVQELCIVFNLLAVWLKLKELLLIMGKEIPSHFISQLITRQVQVFMSYRLIMLLPACMLFIIKQLCHKPDQCLCNQQMGKP